MTALLAAAMGLAVAGCQWETEPASAAQTTLQQAGFFYDPDETSESACLANASPVSEEACPRAATGPFPGCGAPFAAVRVQAYPGCDPCDPNRDCRLTDMGGAVCTCRAQLTQCLFHGTYEGDGAVCACSGDGSYCDCVDGRAGCGCSDVGALCDCGDGRGEVYSCECEGGGDECGCREEVACEGP